jgi:phage terminase large subunit
MSLDLDQSLDTLIAWKRKPHAMVEDLFGVKPDPWQREALEAFPHSPRMAMKACAGPGKTALLAWLGWNFLLTRPHAMIGATSVNAANLRANLWTELARWHAAPRAGMLRALFTMTKTEIFANDHPQTWRLEARTWAQDANAEQIGNALAGLHAKYVMWLLDESGAYPDSIMPVCEAIFAGDPTEAHIVQAGNPTHLSGPLYAACAKARRFWRVIEITADPDDPKRTTRVSVEHARQQIATYGRDNPWVKVRVFGEFPPASLNALIGPDEVSAAMKRRYARSAMQPRSLASMSRALATTRARLLSGKGSRHFLSRPTAISIRPTEPGLSRAPGMTSARMPVSSTTPEASDQDGLMG